MFYWPTALKHFKMHPVPSPCISLCQMDAPTGLCTGCWRTIDEIVKWGAMNDEEKQEVWARLDKLRSGVVFGETPRLNPPLRT